MGFISNIRYRLEHTKNEDSSWKLVDQGFPLVVEVVLVATQSAKQCLECRLVFCISGFPVVFSPVRDSGLNKVSAWLVIVAFVVRKRTFLGQTCGVTTCHR